MIEKIKFKNIEIPIFIHDNKSKDTFLFIHGYFSSKGFIGNLPNRNNNFNIISFSYPGSNDVEINSKDLSFELILELINFILKRIKTKRITIVGHSLGGALAAEIGKQHFASIENVVYISPLHPFINNVFHFKGMKVLLKENKAIKITKKMTTSIIKKISLDSLKNTHRFIDQNDPWFNISKEIITKDFLEKLYYNFKITKDKSIYLVGSHDQMINTKEFVNFVHSKMNKDVYIIDKAKHSPLLENLNETYKILNLHTKKTKRFFWQKKIFKF